jgi:hypothetical protein
MKKPSQPEVWQRGPVDGVPGLLQPVAHALLQAVEDIEAEMENFSPDLLSGKPGGVASVGFHLRHLKGVIDRLFTYARGEMLSEEQMTYLDGESVPHRDDTVQILVDRFKSQVSIAIGELKAANASKLTDERLVGRKRIPSTVIGLWFHAAEHVQRHVGQLIVTARILRSLSEKR